MEELIVKMGNLNQYADDNVIPVESTGTFDEFYDRAMSCWDIPYFEETEVYFQDRDDCYRLSKEEDRKSMMAECAEKTLDYFNRINGTDYKFEKYVELVLSNYEHSHAIHCNFIAKPEMAPLKAGDLSAKLFFAELIPFGISERWVTDCAMLDGGEDDIKKECLMCPPGSGEGRTTTAHTHRGECGQRVSRLDKDLQRARNLQLTNREKSSKIDPFT